MPALVAFEDQTEELIVRLPAAPFEVVLDALVAAAREVCERAEVWRFVWLDRVDAQATITFADGGPTYGSFPPTGDASVDYEVAAIADVHTVRAVRTRDTGSVLLQQIGKEALFQQYPQVALAFGRIDGEPLYYYIDEDNAGPPLLYFVPCPEKPGGMQVRMELTLKSKLSAAVMDAVVWDKIRDVVLHGVMQRMLTIQDVAWTDLELASYHARQFVFRLSQLQHADNLGIGKRPLMVTPRPWA